MPAEIVLQLAKWDPKLKDLTKDPDTPCASYHVPGAAEAARILVCETHASGGGLALYRELSALLARHWSGECDGPVWPGCRADGQPHCRQVLAINLGAQRVRGLDTWVKRNWTDRFGDRAAVMPIAPAALESSLKPGRHIGSWQIAFWSVGAHEKAVDVLRAAAIGARKSIFLSYVRKDAAPLADKLWKRLGELGFDVFMDRFTARLGQRFAEEIEEKVATAEAVVLLQSPSSRSSEWVRREVAVARSVGTGVLVVAETRSKPPSFAQPADVLHRPASVWKRPSQGHVNAIARFVSLRSAMASLRASVYCERSMRDAAGRRSLPVHVVGAGLFDVGGTLIAPRGQPPSLNDLYSAWVASASMRLVVVSETQRLRPATRAPIAWVARGNSIYLRRRADLVTVMRAIRNGSPP